MRLMKHQVALTKREPIQWNTVLKFPQVHHGAKILKGSKSHTKVNPLGSQETSLHKP